MSRKFAGKVAIHGIDGTVAYGSLTSAKNKVQSHQLQDQFQKTNLMDGSGDIIGKAGYSRERTVTIETIIIDESSPSALATAKTNTALPADMFTAVTIANSGITFLDGSWNYEGGTYDGRVGEYHKLTLTLTQVDVGGTLGHLSPVT